MNCKAELVWVAEQNVKSREQMGHKYAGVCSLIQVVIQSVRND